MAKSTTRFRCVTCGRLTAGRLPRSTSGEAGDTTFRYPRRHKGPDGSPCPGVFQEAEWVDEPPALTKAEAKRMVCDWVAVNLMDIQTSGWEGLSERDEEMVVQAAADLQREMKRRSAAGWPGSEVTE